MPGHSLRNCFAVAEMVFWKQGYDGTSYADLTKASGKSEQRSMFYAEQATKVRRLSEAVSSGRERTVEKT
jgi:hypothetical protein